jgi:rare lipoprotein A
MPASADVFDNWLDTMKNRESLSVSGERSVRARIDRDEDGVRSERRRVARATISDDEDFDYRPRRVQRDGDRVRHTGPSRKSRHAYRSEVAAIERPAPHVRSPKWTHRSVSSGHVSGSGQTGMASYYWQGQRVASGGWFNPNAMTAAHKTLPFGTRVRVTHAGNGRSVDVVINDRGPYVAGRIIDLSRAAASAIGMMGQGVARIRMTVLGR